MDKSILKIYLLKHLRNLGKNGYSYETKMELVQTMCQLINVIGSYKCYAQFRHYNVDIHTVDSFCALDMLTHDEYRGLQECGLTSTKIKEYGWIKIQIYIREVHKVLEQCTC